MIITYWLVSLRETTANAMQPHGLAMEHTASSIGLLLASPDCLKEVLIRLDGVSLACAAATCREMREVSEREDVWQVLYARRWKRPSPNAAEGEEATVASSSSFRWHSEYKRRHHLDSQAGKAMQHLCTQHPTCNFATLREAASLGVDVIEYLDSRYVEGNLAERYYSSRLKVAVIQRDAVRRMGEILSDSKKSFVTRLLQGAQQISRIRYSDSDFAVSKIRPQSEK